ncbi:hypothetical protein AHiyo4_06990 [Arthrobacter sp. Hiyo4]|nr:hypothetical protein AHiyo4_06990 [Arthrobacter sp. Hiyo4]
MTNAVAAALGISADILGGSLRWANTIHHRVTSPGGAMTAVAVNAGVAARLATDWGKLATGKSVSGRPAVEPVVEPAGTGVPTGPPTGGPVPADGDATVYRDGARPAAPGRRRSPQWAAPRAGSPPSAPIWAGLSTGMTAS